MVIILFQQGHRIDPPDGPKVIHRYWTLQFDTRPWSVDTFYKTPWEKILITLKVITGQLSVDQITVTPRITPTHLQYAGTMLPNQARRTILTISGQPFYRDQKYLGCIVVK